MAASSSAPVSAPPSAPLTCAFPRAAIYNSEDGARDPAVAPQGAWVAFVHSLRWFPAARAPAGGPQSLLDFRGQPRLELARLDADAGWDDVEKAVCAFHGATGAPFALRVGGRLSSRQCVVVVVASTQSERDDWIDALRIRVAPWSALRARMESLMNGQGGGCTLARDAVHAVIEGRGAGVAGRFGAQGTTLVVSGSRIASWEAASEAMGVQTFLDVAPNAVETFATIVKVAREHAVEISTAAEQVADIAKCVSVVGCVFQVAALGARCVRMAALASEGRVRLPGVYGELGNLAGKAADCMLPVLDPAGGVEELRVEKVFEVYEECMEELGAVEEFLIANGMQQWLDASYVTELEGTVRMLKRDVVGCLNTCATTQNTIAVQELRQAMSAQTLSAADRSQLLLAVPAVSPHFVGREEEMRRLWYMAKEHGCAVVVQHGGAGKTQLMAAFARQVQNKLAGGGRVFWVNAYGRKSDVVAAFAEFAEGLGWLAFSREHRSDVGKVMHAVCDCLDRVQGRWMMCVDSADDADAVEVLKSLLSGSRRGNGWVIVTSRRGNLGLWAQAGVGKTSILELRGLSEDDGKRLLLALTSGGLERVRTSSELLCALEELRAEDREALGELCGCNARYSLSEFPLALVQAGSYIASNRISFSKYFDIFRKKLDDPSFQSVFEDAVGEGHARPAQMSVWTTLAVNVKLLGSLEEMVLFGIALLGRSSVSEILAMYLIGACDGAAEGVKCDVAKLNTVVMKKLVNEACLVGVQGGGLGGGRRVFEMHLVVAQFMRSGLWKSSKNDFGMLTERTARAAGSAVHGAVGEVLGCGGYSWDALPVVYDADLRVLAPHAVEVLQREFARGNDDSDKWAGVLEATAAKHIGRFACSVEMATGRFRSAVEICRGMVDLLQLLMLREVGSSPRATRRAVRQLKRKGKSGLEHEFGLDTSQFLLLSGKASSSAGDLRTAENDTRRSLSVCDAFERTASGRWTRLRRASSVTQTDGASGLVQAHCFQCLHRKCLATDQLGAILLARGDCAGAERELRASLQTKERTYDTDVAHPGIAATRHSLGGVLLARGDCVGAESELRVSLRTKERIHGADAAHPSIAATRHELGRVLLARGKCAGAERELRASLKTNERIYGTDAAHPGIAATRHELGDVLLARGDCTGAERELRASLRAKERIHGANAAHPDIAATLHALGSVLLARGDCAGAEREFWASLGTNERVHGVDAARHPGIAATRHELGRVLLARGDCAGAERELRASLNAKERIHGANAAHPDIAATRHALGGVLLALGDCAGAERELRASLEINTRIHGTDAAHPDIAASRHKLGSVLLARGDHAGAERELRASLRTNERIHGADAKHPGYAATRHELGRVLLARGDYAGAERELRKSLETNKRIFGAGMAHPGIAATQHELGGVLLARGDCDGAESEFRASLEMQERIYGANAAHPITAAMRHSLGGVLLARGDYDGAERELQASLDMNNRIHGANAAHPDIAATRHKLGGLLLARGDCAAAERELRASLETKERIHGADAAHPDIAATRHELGRVLLARGDCIGAEREFRASLEMNERVHGANAARSDIAATRHELGRVLFALGDCPGAERELRASLEVEERIHGAGAAHPDIEATRRELGRVLLVSGGRWSEARASGEHAG